MTEPRVVEITDENPLLDDSPLSNALDAKDNANRLFRQGLYEEAKQAYYAALLLVPGYASPGSDSDSGSDSDLDSDSESPSPHPNSLNHEKNEESIGSESKELLCVLFSNIAACCIHQNAWEEGVRCSSSALSYDPQYGKALMRRSRCYEELGRLYEAMQDLETADALDIAGLNAKREIARLKPRMEEKMEKDKDDLLGKLKDLGNGILGKFGLSVDNFKAEKNETGGYSISFQK